MKKPRVLISVFIFALLSLQVYSQTDDSKTGDQIELDLILKKCAEYCEKLNNSVLDFICMEKITEEIHKGSPGLMLGIELNSYIYDYQFIRGGESIHEKRNLIRENGLKKNIVDTQLKTKRFRHKHVIFGPIGLLSEKQQEIHDYQIVDERNYKKEKVVILEALPKFPEISNTLYGKIWIRKKDFRILKIEWKQESLENIEAVDEIAKKWNSKPIITFISEYAFEKNEIRFPSRYSVDELYLLPNGIKHHRSKLTVIYDDYKFFTVDTKVKY
ncbi:MAG: hypothetical protein MUP98_03500 [Candidatus Aminicenantes bacterium]|nr:hypothetical protein [Candidatus Aminicenantes bacterium]